METAAIAVVISGAPGSAKTTLAGVLSNAMWLPHLNKDIAAASLRRGGASAEVANKRAFVLVYGTAATWMSSGMSVVIDMTMYPEYSPAEVGSLLPHGAVVNVHCRARDAVARWEAKMLRFDSWIRTWSLAGPMQAGACGPRTGAPVLGHLGRRGYATRGVDLSRGRGRPVNVVAVGVICGLSALPLRDTGRDKEAKTARG